MHEKVKSRFLISANIFLPFEPETFAFHLLCKIIKNRKYSQPKGIEPKMSEDNKWCNWQGALKQKCKTRAGCRQDKSEYKRIKESCSRASVAQRVPGGLGCQIS
jgi:hypothetical protein